MSSQRKGRVEAPPEASDRAAREGTRAGVSFAAGERHAAPGQTT